MTTITRDAVFFHNRHVRYGKMLHGDACIPGDICVVDRPYSYFDAIDSDDDDDDDDVTDRKPLDVFMVLHCRTAARTAMDTANYISVDYINDCRYMMDNHATFSFRAVGTYMSMQSYAKLFDYAFWSRTIKAHVYSIDNSHPWLHKHFGVELATRCIESAAVVANRDGIQMVRIIVLQHDDGAWRHVIRINLYRHQFSDSHLLQRLDMISTHNITNYVVTTPANSSKRLYLDAFSCDDVVAPNCGPTVLGQYITTTGHMRDFTRHVTICGRSSSTTTQIDPTTEEHCAILEPIFALHTRVCGERDIVPLTWTPKVFDDPENRASYDWYHTLAPRILQLCLMFSAILSPYVLERVIDYLPYMMFPSHVRKIALIIGCRNSVQRIMNAHSQRTVETK